MYRPIPALSKNCVFFLRISLSLTGVVCLLALAAPTMAQLSGAIFTTNSTGTQVNGNIYANKADVYLDGGPQNKNDPGLPDGTYYFQVTDPSGAVLLSADDISCRQVVVSGGRIVGVPSAPLPAACTDGYHNLGTFNSANGEQPIQLCNPNASKCPTDFADTPNPGGEYKVWITPIANYSPNSASPHCSTASNIRFGFCDSDSKTDNFKVTKPNAAYITVCKFNDENGNGVQDSGEPLIAFWPITAAGVDTVSGPIGTVNTVTDASGCASFSVSDFTTAGRVVTLTEGFLAGSWQQTAPAVGTLTVPDGNPSSNGTVTVTVATNTAARPTNFETVAVAPGDNVVAPYFGNTCLDSSCGGNTIQLMVSKDANPSLTRTFAWGISKSVDKTSVSTSGGSVTFNYTVNVTHDSGTDSGWQVTGTIKVSNPSLVPISGVTITDVVDNGGACAVSGGTGITVPPNSQAQIPYTCTYSNSPANGTNTATASWDSSSAVGTATVNFSNPGIKLVDDSVNVTDTLGGTLGTASSTDPSPKTFTYSQTFTANPVGTCTTHNNTATFTTDTSGTTGSASQSVQVCVGGDLTVSKTASASFTRTYNWGIAKSANPTAVNQASGTSANVSYMATVNETGFTDSAWQVTGTITVSNPNDWEAVSVNLSDAINNGGTCTVAGGASQSVPEKGSISPTYTCTYASAPSPTAFTNTAAATWNAATYFTPDGSASGTANGDFASVSPTKVNATVTPTDAFNGGAAVNLCALQSGTPCTLTATDTTPYTSQTYTYSRSESVPAATCTTYPNTASTGTGKTASASVKVCGASPLAVTKTAAGALTSAISKSVNKTTVQQSGGAITFNYTVTVTESAWTVTGTITVTNPNDWEAITANLADALSDGSGTCTVTGGGVQTVPASSSLTPKYACTFPSTGPTANSGTNTATATWNAATYFTSTGTAYGTAPYGFVTLTITDNVQSSANTAGCNATLGSVSVTTTTPSGIPGCGVTSLASPKWGVFTYSITDNNAAPAMCASFNNTAQITGGSSSNQVTVTVCNTNTGALTMGFWKNSNGQKITSGANQAALGAWLKQFNPFGDAPSSGLASYVANVIGGATCSTGGTCNTMLRAQMLATALDVYFSTPGLGGNVIGAYNGLGTKQPPLGGVAIDLSHLCSMIDGSGGATCSGSYEDARPEFGVAAPSCTGTTVSQMLAYANYLSGVNGSPVATANTGASWYQQVKNPKQVYAKDGFDNTNNQTANIASASCPSSF